MDNRDLLYSNKYIPHPLRPLQNNTGLRDPAANSMIRNYNSQHQLRNRSHHGASNQILPRNVRRSLFDQQMKRSVETNKSDYQLQRTTLSIDSAYRQTETSFLEIPFFKLNLNENSTKMIEIIPNGDNDIQMIITFQFSSLSQQHKDFLTNEFPNEQICFILQDIPQWPNDNMNQSQNTFFGIPLQHINYNSSTGYPIHSAIHVNSSIENNSGTVTITCSLTQQTNAIGITSLTSSVSGAWENAFSITRVTNISPGYPTSQRYKINLGYTFKNVVAVRLLNTIIPNVSYMINSTTRKNNKLQWVNECSRVKVPQDVLYPMNMSGVVENLDFTINASGGILVKNFHSNQNTLGAYIVNSQSQNDTINKMYLNGEMKSISGSTNLITMYSLRHITLHGGSYTPDTLATELEKELNKELSSSSTHDHGFNEFSWQLGHFQNRLQTNNQFHSEIAIPSTARFFVNTEDKKRIISIQQCQRIYYNNRNTLDESQNKIATSGPFRVNAGIPYLYIYHPGALVQSGDSIRIDNALDILNIKESELNREHRVIVCSVKRYTVSIHVPQISEPIDSLQNTNVRAEENPFTLFEIITEKENSLTKFGRIIRAQRINTINDSDFYEIDVEMMRGENFSVSGTLIAHDSNVICNCSGTGVLQINAHTGYNIKLSHVPSRSVLTGIGTTELFIGVPISFKILFGADESPRDVLGARSDMSGKNNEAIQCAKVQSNIVDVHEIHITKSYILPSMENELMHTISLELIQECSYSIGDRIFIKNHMPYLHLHTDQEMFGFRFTQIEKNGDKVKLSIDKSSFQSKNSQFGEIPETHLAWPFKEDDWIYICHNEKHVPVYEKDEYIVTLTEPKTYESGKPFENTIAIVQESAYESHTFRVKVPEGSTFPTFDNIELARAKRSNEYLFRTQGIPNGSYKILTTNNDNTITLDLEWDTLHMPNNCDESTQSGFGRAFQPELSVGNISGVEISISDSGISQNNSIIQTRHENTIYTYNSSGVQEYYTTTPRESELCFKRTSVNASNTYENIKIRKCSSAYQTVLNDHNGYVITGISENKKNVHIQVPKTILKLSVSGVENEQHMALYKRNSNYRTEYGQFGTMCMHEVDKPYIVSDHFMYLKCPTLATLRNTEKHSLQDIFAKIMLPGKVGSYVYDTFVASPKIFHDHPLRELHELYFHFVNKYGETIEFNELEHSLVLEIVEAKERLESMNVQMSK